MFRCRMFPTKINFKGRWGDVCTFCNNIESDVHLFACPGYSDLLDGIQYIWFTTLECSFDQLKEGAEALVKVKTRLEVFNK